MRNALYYPHTQIRDEGFLKNALLVWDEVRFISPSRNFIFDRDMAPVHREALELLCRAHIPSDDEKQAVHKRVVNLLHRGMPDWLIATQVPDEIRLGRPVREHYGSHPEFGMYPQKLAQKTWNLLEGAGLVRLSGSDFDYYTRPLVGFLLMSLLADACAGTETERITDRADAYGFLARTLAAENGADSSPITNSKDAARLDRLVTLSIKTINTDDIPLKKILALRKHEAGGQGHDYRAFRQKYGEKLRQYVAQATKAKTERDWKEIEHQFQQDLKDDLSSLRDELKVAKTKLLLSKEMGTMVAAGASIFLEPISASVLLTHTAQAIAGGAFLSDLSNYAASYKKALRDHPTSWLYLAEKPKLRNVPFGAISHPRN